MSLRPVHVDIEGSNEHFQQSNSFNLSRMRPFKLKSVLHFMLIDGLQCTLFQTICTETRIALVISIHLMHALNEFNTVNILIVSIGQVQCTRTVNSKSQHRFATSLDPPIK